MLYWLYDMPTLLAVALFAVFFMGVCWIGIILLSPRLVPLVHQQPGLNEILGDYLQYFGVIYGLLLGLLAVATYLSQPPVPGVSPTGDQSACLKDGCNEAG